MRVVCSCLFLLFLSSCSAMQSLHVPELTGAGLDPQLVKSCEQVAVQGNSQFVHSIAFEMANGQGATVIGVTVLDDETIKTGLMGVEGFVLFEAELAKDKRLNVKRALPPFDNLEFAAGLMRDVEDIFLFPSGKEKIPVTGQLADGASVCRYQGGNGQIIDIIIGRGGSSRTDIYDTDGRMNKSIVRGNTIINGSERIPETIQLTAHGLQGYTLKMTLISVDRL